MISKKNTQSISKTPTGKMLWKVELRAIIDANKTKHAIKDKTVSTATKKTRHEILFMFFTDLRQQTPFKLDNPHNLREKHFEAVLDYWVAQGLSSSTLQNRTSVIRTFCTWIGRPNMVKPLQEYIKDKTIIRRKQVAQVDKSWSGNEVSFQDILQQIDSYDERAGAQMRIIKAFGLRKEEAVCFQPIRAMRLGQDTNTVFIEKGTKNGLKRHLPVDNDEKREALAYACKVAKTAEGHIGWADRTLEQAVKRMTNIMSKFGITKKSLGVTLHGLRHERMHDIHLEVTGEPCAIRGGKLENIDPELEMIARHRMTQEAGHARLSITTAYSGSFKQSKSVKDAVATD